MVKKSGLCSECNKDACPYDAYLKIEKGRIVSGMIDSASLGERTGKLVDAMFREYGAETVERFYNGICRLSAAILTRKGMTTGIDEYKTSDSVEKTRKEAIRQELEEAEKLVAEYRNGTLEHIPGKSLGESLEARMLILGAKVKSTVEKEIMREKISEVLAVQKPKYNTTIMVLSKARGGPTNLTNMIGMYGQASVREGRPKRGFRERLIAGNRKGDIGALAGGFIENNFNYGLEPKEFFAHAMGGRQGEVDTGVATKVSGYLYRRLANSLKDLFVHNDGTTRTANNNLIQFIYGEDSIFPMNTIRGKSIDVERALQKARAIKEAKAEK